MHTMPSLASVKATSSDLFLSTINTPRSISLSFSGAAFQNSVVTLQFDKGYFNLVLTVVCILATSFAACCCTLQTYWPGINLSHQKYCSWSWLYMFLSAVSSTTTVVHQIYREMHAHYWCIFKNNYRYFHPFIGVIHAHICTQSRTLPAGIRRQNSRYDNCICDLLMDHHVLVQSYLSCFLQLNGS